MQSKKDYTIFSKPMSHNVTDEYECKTDGSALIMKQGKHVIIVENASCILINAPGLELYVNNINKKSVFLQGNELTGLNNDAIVFLNEDELKPVNGVLVISKLSPLPNSTADTQTFMRNRLFNNNTPINTEVDTQAKEKRERLEQQLHSAAMDGSWEEVQSACEAGVNPNAKSKKHGGATAAYLASQNRNIAVLRVLKQYDADFNLADNDGTTPAFIAAQQGYADVITLLGKYGANLNTPYDGKTPLSVAVNNGNKEVILALSHYVDINQSRNNVPLIFYALQLGCGLIKTERLPSSLELRKLPSLYNYILTPEQLYYVSQGKESKSVVLLDTQVKKLHELFPQSINKLSGKQLKDIQEITNHVHQFDVLETMILCKANCNATMEDSNSLILLAVSLGYYEATKLLINYGAALNSIHTNGFNLLTAAASEGRLDLMRLLINNGADIKLKLPSGLSPLFIAAQNGHTETVKFILSKHLINLPIPFVSSEEKLIQFSTAHGETCVSNMKRVIQNKVHAGAKNTSIEITPSEIASVMGHEHIAKLISNAGMINRDENQFIYVKF